MNLVALVVGAALVGNPQSSGEHAQRCRATRECGKLVIRLAGEAMEELCLLELDGRDLGVVSRTTRLAVDPGRHQLDVACIPYEDLGALGLSIATKAVSVGPRGRVVIRFDWSDLETHVVTAQDLASSPTVRRAALDLPYEASIRLPSVQVYSAFPLYEADVERIARCYRRARSAAPGLVGHSLPGRLRPLEFRVVGPGVLQDADLFPANHRWGAISGQYFDQPVPVIYCGPVCISDEEVLEHELLHYFLAQLLPAANGEEHHRLIESYFSAPPEPEGTPSVP